MADEFNSMQAQLGLVGNGGGFNPLGIATPAPPPPPPVRHPGDVSRDIVQQTQTQMATTLQTTSAMRLGGMGGLAFGGGGAGGGIGATGAFAQQFQQNMQGIQSQHVGAFSAQMMGNMSGMGGGFQPGMMPHPAMMTAPGMGIYRPFPQPQGPSVSPFQQMPLFQTPFTPMPPPPQFQTPMDLSANMAMQAGQRRTAAMFATPGVAARAGMDIGAGFMGAGVGAALGAHFGPMGARIGGTLGMAAGAFGAEHFGLGSTAQHIADNLNPFRTMAIRGQQMMGASQSWGAGGADMNMATGRGLSQHGATHLGRMLEDTAFSSRFRRETGGAFSAQDLTKITQVSGQQGLLQDTQSVDQIHDRVKTIAKSLVSFMKIANEPNVVEALKSMGKARQMGLSIGETMDMAMEARQYSKMSGQSVSGIMGGAGMQGAMLYQQQGLSAGLGMRMGMGAMGSASAAVGAGAFSAQRLAMLGGTQGVAQHEMEMSAAFLKQPMMAAAMPTMGKGGGFSVDTKALGGMMRGNMDVGQMATRGAENMLGAVHKQGVGAFAMQEMQSTELQDTMGRIMGPQGTKIAQMNFIEQQRKMMGLEQNPGGYAMAGRSLGYSPDQMKVVMGEASSPGYFDTQRKHLQVRKMEARALESQEFERNRKGLADKFGETDVGSSLRTSYNEFRGMGEDVNNFFFDDEETKQAKSRGQVMLKTSKDLIMDDEDFRIADKEGMTGERGKKLFENRRASLGGRGQLGSNLGRAFKDAALGGNDQDLLQRRQVQGGLAEFFGGGLMERGARLAASAGGLGGVTDAVFGSAAEIRQKNEDTNTSARVFGAGLSMTGDEETAAKMKLSGVEGGQTGMQLNIGLEAELGKLAQSKTKTGMGEIAAGAGIGALLGPVGMAVGAGAAALFGGKTNNRMDIKETREATRKYLESQGKTGLSEKEIDAHIEAATKGAESGQGNNEKAFRGRETINTAARDASMAELQAMRSKRLHQMVGTEQGAGDTLKGVMGAAMALPTGGASLLVAEASKGMSAAEEGEISRVDKKLFRTGESADAGALAALQLAAEGGDEEAGKRAKDLADTMHKSGKGNEVDRARTMKKDLEKSGGSATARKMGTQLAKGTKNAEEVQQLVAANRASGQAEGLEARRKVGSEKMSGRSDEEFASKSTIDKLRTLSEGSLADLPAKTREMVEKFQEAEGDADAQARIAEKYSKMETTIGTISERSMEAGDVGKGDKIIKDMLADSADTQVSVGKNFPDVDTFDSASRRLLQAAQYLMGSGGTTLPVPTGGEIS